MSGSGFRIRMPWLTALVVAAIVACGGEDGNPTDPGDPPGPPDPPDPPDPPAVLECQREGYPCSLAEVDVAVLERSEALADEAWIMVEGGASMAEAATWLAEQPDVVEARSDASVLRFRVEGGRGT